ncbi:MAG TPA: YlcI/YnfO family protein [Gaiellaceae bacterium]|jgi:predicted HicB family RNase H-like nuclease|nr:YlcI/YnfO family protein [Gaiellaceae bacterium]
MQMANHVKAIQADLAAAAALGDEAAAEAGRRLSEALESSLYVRLLDILTEAAVGLSGTLPGHVEVRLAGREPELVFVADASGEVEPQPLPGDDTSARITLRLPESLKSSVETVAAGEGVSTNAWIVRALARALEPRPTRTVRTGNRLQGFAQS